MIELEIPKDKFLPVYHHFLDKNEIFDVDFLYGGRDSGKSREVAHQVIMDCMQTKGYKCLLIRKILNTVRDSQYSLIQSVIEEWGLTKFFKFNSSRLEIICTLNGSGFYGRGLDEVGRIKSFNNPSACWIEEGNQITNEDFVVILTSLRSNNVRVKTWFSFNPECAVNYTDFWLYQEWFEHTDQLSFVWIKQIDVDDEIIEFRVRATHSTYRDNPYCPAQRKALYESYAHSKNNSYWYQTYTLGLWGYRRTGDEFWKCFDEYKHTDTLNKINSTYHVVLDSNVNPYVSVQIWQIDISNMSLMQVGEIPCESPENTASKAAKAVIRYLDRLDYNDKVYIYGDPSANAKNTIDDEGRSFFDKFIGVMKAHEYDIVKRVGSSAPSVSTSGAFINEIMEVEYGGWKIMIDKSCRKSIEDYNMAKEDIDGTMLKKKTQNKETGVSYEKYGHFSDCLISSTLVKTIDGDVPIKDIRPGDLVLTRKGYRKVLRVWDKGVKKVNTYKIGESEITCTPNHKIFTEEMGFRDMEDIYSGTFCVLGNHNQIIHEKEVVSKGQESYQNVYDIEVEGEHEFFANGVLVHNCMRYFITTVLGKLYKMYMTRRIGTPQPGGVAVVSRVPNVTL